MHMYIYIYIHSIHIYIYIYIHINQPSSSLSGARALGLGRPRDVRPARGGDMAAQAASLHYYLTVILGRTTCLRFSKLHIAVIKPVAS